MLLENVLMVSILYILSLIVVELIVAPVLSSGLFRKDIVALGGYLLMSPGIAIWALSREVRDIIVGVSKIK
jgi:hypothetical protein